VADFNTADHDGHQPSGEKLCVDDLRSIPRRGRIGIDFDLVVDQTLPTSRIETGSGLAETHTNPTRKRGTPAEAGGRCIAAPLACASG